MRNERGAKNTCIIRRGGELREDMELERLQTMKMTDNERGGAAKPAVRSWIQREEQDGMAGTW